MIRTALLLLAFVVTFAALVGLVALLGNIGPIELLVILVIAIAVPVAGARWHGRRTTV
jgi:hypothetical protein